MAGTGVAPAPDADAAAAAAISAEVTAVGGKTSSWGAAPEDHGPSTTASVGAGKEGGDELVAKRAYKLKFQVRRGQVLAA
jgi:hypothetical protein